MRKENNKSKIVASIISTTFVVGAAVVLLVFNMQGKTVDDVKKDVEKIADKVGGKTDKDSSEDDPLKDLVYNKLCVCEAAADKYSNWMDSGYINAPRQEYDINNLNMEWYAYGFPVAERDYHDEIGMLEMTYQEENIEKAPEYAVEGKEFKSGVYSKDCISKINDKLCLPYVMSDVAITKINIKDKVGSIDDKYIVFDSFYNIVDKQTGKIAKSIPQEEYKGDTTGLGELCYLEIELQVDCHCPWVTYYDYYPELIWIKDNGEYLMYDGTIARPEIYSPRIGYDGLPVYSETYNQGNGYPITGGNTYKFKYGYIVDKASLENLYLEMKDSGVKNYASRYINLIKAVE